MVIAVEVEVVAVAVAAVVPVGRGVDELGGGGGGAGDGEREGDELSSGADGRGHVISLKFSGQNSLTFSYRYHCRLLERPAGGRTRGSSSAFGDHDWTFKIDLSLRLTQLSPSRRCSLDVLSQTEGGGAS